MAEEKKSLEDVFDTWFAKDGWDLESAAYLILGYDPKIADGSDGWDKIFEDDWIGPNHFLNYIEDLKICLVQEVWGSLGVKRDAAVAPAKISQWVEDSGYAHCDRNFYSYIKRKTHYTDNSWLGPPNAEAHGPRRFS